MIRLYLAISNLIFRPTFNHVSQLATSELAKIRDKLLFNVIFGYPYPLYLFNCGNYKVHNYLHTTRALYT